MRSKMLFVCNKKEHKNKPTLYLTILLVVSSLVFSIVTVYDLAWEQDVSKTRGFLLFVYGMVFFTALYVCLNNALLKTAPGLKLVKRYKLSNGDVFDINNKLVSAVQAVFCCMTGATVCLYSCSRDPLHTSHYVSKGYAWFGAAYFLYDIWSMWRVHVTRQREQAVVEGDGRRRKSDSCLRYLKEHAVIVGHHLFIGGFGFLTITYLRGGLGDCYFGFIYLMEASTPFVSARGILSKMGLKTSNVYVANGIVMLVVFFLCRIAMFPYVIYLYSQSINQEYLIAIKSLPRNCKLSIMILLLPQVYWFMLMIEGASKILKPKLMSNSATNNYKRRFRKNSHS